MERQVFLFLNPRDHSPCGLQTNGRTYIATPALDFVDGACLHKLYAVSTAIRLDANGVVRYYVQSPGWSLKRLSGHTTNVLGRGQRRSFLDDVGDLENWE